MERRKGIRKFLIEIITQTFSYALLGAVVAGVIIDRMSNYNLVRFVDDGFFFVGMGGLTYSSILQMFGLSVALGVLLLIFVSDFYLTKYMLLWRYMFFLGAASITISLFVLIFGWFRNSAWQGWLTLIGSFALFSSVAMIPTFIKTKREDKEYEKALSDYKLKQMKK